MNAKSESSNLERGKGLLAGTIFAIIIGAALLFIKITLAYGDSFTVLAWRFNFALLTALIIALIVKKEKYKLLNFDRNTLFIAILYPLFMILQTTGLVYATSIEASILFAIVPILATCFSIFILNEKANMIQTIFMVISIIALIYMILSQPSDDNKTEAIGLILLCASSFAMAICNVWMRKVRDFRKPFQLTFPIVVAGFIASNIACGVATGFDGYITPILEWEFLLSSIYLGGLSITCSSLLSAYSLSKLSAIEGTMFSNLSTVFSIVIGALILKEAFGFPQLIATVAVVVAVICISIFNDKKN